MSPPDDSPPDDRSSHHRDLDDSFFRKPRAELLERLRGAERTRTQQMETLAEVSGIDDVGVLEKLVLLGIRSETLAALTLYPLVAVAWADGKVDRREREAVLRGAAECGVEPGSVSHDLLAGWLEERPDSVLLSAWQGLVGELARQVDAEWRVVFARELLGRAQAVAEASGGFLALEKTSADEQSVMDRLRSAFEE
jgi:tellurite resistance protein